MMKKGESSSASFAGNSIETSSDAAPAPSAAEREI